MNRHITTVIVVPLTTAQRAYPTRVRLRFRGKDGQAVVDQIRTVDKVRMVRKLGEVPPAVADQVSEVIIETFWRH